MCDGDDGGGYVPGEAQEGADGHQDSHPEQVQVIATALLPRAQVNGTSSVLGETTDTEIQKTRLS